MVARGHGLAGNNWFDGETGKRVYCVEDPRHTLIGVPSKPHQGTSPRNLTTTTIGDEREINPFMRASSAAELGERRAAKDSF